MQWKEINISDDADVVGMTVCPTTNMTTVIFEDGRVAWYNSFFGTHSHGNGVLKTWFGEYGVHGKYVITNVHHLDDSGSVLVTAKNGLTLVAQFVGATDKALVRKCIYAAPLPSPATWFAVQEKSMAVVQEGMKELRNFGISNEKNLCATMLPNGVHAAVLSQMAEGKTNHYVRVWDTRIGEVLFSAPVLTSSARNISATPDGKRLILTGVSDVVFVIDLETGSQTGIITKFYADSVCVHPNNRLAVVFCRGKVGVAIIDLETSKSEYIQTNFRHNSRVHGTTVVDAMIVPDMTKIRVLHKNDDYSIQRVTTYDIPTDFLAAGVAPYIPKEGGDIVTYKALTPAEVAALNPPPIVQNVEYVHSPPPYVQDRSADAAASAVLATAPPSIHDAEGTAMLSMGARPTKRHSFLWGCVVCEE